MRNTILRKLVDEVTAKINDGIQSGIEPLALAFILRNMADQCDKLAQTFEQKESEEQDGLEKKTDEP